MNTLFADKMRLTIEALQYSAKKAAIMAEFNKPLSSIDIDVLREDGFSAARSLASSCLSWIWFLWLQGGSERLMKGNVAAFVDKGMKMQEKSSLFYMRPHADLYLLHCAIFGASQNQLEKLATRVVDASGIKGHRPKDDGELYASAWCGMLKHAILGDMEKAQQQSDLIWNAYRPPSFSAASKSLVMPWLRRDWKGFVKAQKKNFEKLWERARKDGTVRAEKEDGIVVTVDNYPVEQKWCWAHCGLALLAHRRGVEIDTDPFWFPTHALTCLDLDLPQA